MKAWFSDAKDLLLELLASAYAAGLVAYLFWRLVIL